MTPHALEHSDGSLKSLAELAQVRADECSCGLAWDDVPAKDRHVQRHPFTDQLVDWSCDSCASKAFDRWNEDRVNDVGAQERAELDYRDKQEGRR